MGRLTKSGRLRTSAKRRKLSGAEPGAIVILSQAKFGRDKGGAFSGAGRGLLEIGVKIPNELVFDGDIRKLVRMLQEAFADHFKASLLAGVQPDGSGVQPPIAKSTKAISERQGGRVGGFGVRSGSMARNWWVGKLTGGTTRAQGTVFPTRDPAILALINKWLARARPVDFQSIDGAARDVAIAVIDEWMEGAIGEFVTTPQSAETSEKQV